ncbi:(Fe-S)-binding protein [Thermodesulfobacteriota bacterium]
MSGMKALKTHISELEDLLGDCMRCGMCQGVCPLFAETGRETDVARGKMALLDGLTQEMFKDPNGVYKHLNKCLLCGSCADNCPSGVNALEIFIKARAILTAFMGLSPAKRLIFRGMLSRPQFFDRLVAWGAKFQSFFTKPANEIVGTSCARFISPLIGHRHFKPLAPVPFHHMVPSLDSSPGRSGVKAAFFVGCLVDKIFPQIARDAVHALNHHEVGIFLPEEQGCCGIPALSAGDIKTFHRLLRHNLGRFDTERFDVLITPCATCTTTLKIIWPMMSDKSSGRIQRKIDAIAQKTLDIHQFLVSTVGLEKPKAENRVDLENITYHDPCHLKKSLGVFSEPRSLIEADPGCRLKEMPEADRCCGLGGTFSLGHYKLSASIGKVKGDHIRSTGCRVVATGCPACMLQLSDILSKSGDRITVKHPIEIYAAFLKSQDTSS